MMRITRLLIAFLLCIVSPSFAQEPSWTEKSPPTSPPARYNHAMAYDAAHDQVVLFGGTAGGGSMFGDTWVWDGTTWTQMFPANSPPARSAHAMAYDAARSQVIMFGGSVTGGAIVAETWVWDGNTWTQKFPANNPGPTWNGRFLAYDAARSKVVFFGGPGQFGGNQTWTWDGQNWTQEFPATSPPPRSVQSMAYDVARQQVVLFGGADVTNTLLSDTWVWDGVNWKQEFASTSPPARGNSDMAYDATQAEVLLFGGGFSSGQGGDSWTWNGSTWTQRVPATGPPPPRFGHALAFDTAHGEVVLFGGVVGGGGGPIFGDTWAWGVTPFLNFPLLCKDAFTAIINTVFDHSMTQPYCPDDIVTAYTGEEGRREFGVSPFTVNFPSCQNRPLHGFKKADGLPFSVGGQYAQQDSEFLFYEGHPGYDYRTRDQMLDGTLCPDTDPLCNPLGTTPVLAAATGTVRCVNLLDHAVTECPEGPGEVKIDHGSGYFTIYLHLSAVSVLKDQRVGTGQQIGVSGAKGPPGTRPHLHFEVRRATVPVDPYGWEGIGDDPYTRATNVNLWR